MATGATPQPLSAVSQAAFIAYYDQVQNNSNTWRTNLRSRLSHVDKAYQRELDESQEQARAKAANKAGDSSRFQNITVPVVMPQVESAVTYQASVFLQGYPIFGTVAAPRFATEALMMQTTIANQAERGGWTREFILFFRDCFKYNLGALECTWDREVTQSIITDLQKNLTTGTPKETLWEGNVVRRLDPYNLILDHRVNPTTAYKDAEYSGYTDRMTRIQLKAFIETLPDKILANIRPAFASGTESSWVQGEDGKGFYIPSINTSLDITTGGTNGSGFNWDAWASLSSAKSGLEYHEMYDVTTLYCRVLPSEFDLRIPKRNIPQVFKLIIVNHQHIIYCERQTNAHNWLPILLAQVMEDGLRTQTKSLAENAEPFQSVTSAYMNSIIHSRRRAVTDRVLYDPSRISSAHINSDNPSAKIPVRPAAYGKPIGEAVYQFPYREDQAAVSLQQIQVLIGLANTLAGQNQASQGQFVKGNKTLHEFESVMQNANGRDQLASILLEAQVFTPLKHILKLNILQYQGGTTLYNRDEKIEVEIDPLKLRQAVIEFKISDGLIPSSKLINGDTFAVALQSIASSPQLSAGHNIGPMFSYLMKTQGADLSDFEKSPEQLAYEQAVQSWQQVVLEAMKQGVDPTKLPPQPLPQNFGWNPRSANPMAPQSEATPVQQGGVASNEQ